MQEYIDSDHHDHPEVEYTETDMNQSSSLMEEEEKKVRYSQSVVDVTKRMLAKYILINRVFCFTMIWVHLTICVISIIISQRASVVLSESQLCRYIFYASHYFYGLVHLGIIGPYLYLFGTLSYRTFENMRHTGWVSMLFFLCISYVLLLKLLADTNCTFWGITVGQLIMQGVQFGAEGLLLKMFYSWLYSKASFYKENLETNVDIVESRQASGYFQGKFGNMLTKYLDN